MVVKKSYFMNKSIEKKLKSKIFGQGHIISNFTYILIPI
jgi:hypothetical protein